ncbi:hypothetical protein MMC12_002612 [Toensbergia leucococca]|nr:hypothetical protein [Toensbergia leucococca]
MIKGQERHVSPFLRCPAEIRLIIYELLLANHVDKTLCIRTERSSTQKLRQSKQQRRSKYRIMSDRFRARSIETSYCLVENPGLFPSILGVNKQIHAEASHVLYSEHTFDFNTDVESVVPFFRDLTPFVLSNIKRVNIVKRALPYVKDFDRCEWRNVCAFISNNLKLVEFGLGILGGKPAAQWEAEETFETSDFNTISRFEGMEWMRQVAAIKGLRNLDVKVHLQHCPPPCSTAMAFFVNFSASVEKGFAEFLRLQMVTRAP